MMSTFDSDDLGDPCYVLTEDGEFRLRKLRDHMRFLSRVAQPRTWGEEADGAPEIAMGELAVCLEFLAEQANRVVEAVSPSRQRNATQTAHMPEPDEAADGVQDAGDTGDEDFIYGVTLDQVDALNHLTALLSAHGDVVSATQTTAFVDHTVPVIGHAIFDGAQAVRDLVREVETQSLHRGKRSASGVREARATYGLAPALVSLLRAIVPGDAARLH